MGHRGNILLEKVKAFPGSPGCYLMKGGRGEVLYVGKAKNLKNRVSSYFKSLESLTPKTQALVLSIEDVDYILTSNEVESFVLENNLIKQYLPKYNIRLRDDKTYPYVQWKKNVSYPRLEYTRKPKVKDLSYEIIGPFPDGHHVGQLLYSLHRLMRLRDCKDSEFKKRKTPCLLYQMEQCSAPCMPDYLQSDYTERLNLVLDFLRKPKKNSKLEKKLTSFMLTSAEDEMFEKAQEYKELLELMKKFLVARVVQSVEDLRETKNIDIVQLVHSDDELDLVVYSLREGLLLGHEHFYWSKTLEELTEVDQNSYPISKLHQYYEMRPIPHVVLGPWNTEEAQSLSEILSKLLSRPILLRPISQKFIKLAEQVKAYGEQKQLQRAKEQLLKGNASTQLALILNTKRPLVRLECFDVAIWQGTSPTASQIVFVDQHPLKDCYRHYHLSVRSEMNNDPAMMLEAISRRLDHEGPYPDVLILDGGKSQLSVVMNYINSKKIDLLVVALAKEKDHLPERLYLPGKAQAIDLRDYPSAMYLLAQMRDEAHRFSRRLHHIQEKKRFFDV